MSPLVTVLISIVFVLIKYYVGVGRYKGNCRDKEDFLSKCVMSKGKYIRIVITGELFRNMII
jgi:hypothetical protein